MSTTNFFIKQGNTLPALDATLKDQNDTVVNLSAEGTMVVFRMVRLDDTVGFEAGASIIDADGGQVRYEWSDGDTDTAGIYRGEFEVTLPSGEMTAPNNGHFVVIVTRRMVVPA